MEIIKPSSKTVNKVVLALNRGNVVICPTDTVYGFLADASNKKAVEKIYRIKKRPKSKPLPLFVKDIKMARELAEISEKQEKVLKKHWPGAHTFILSCRRRPTSTLSSDFDKHDVGRRVYFRWLLYGIAKNTVALRVPKHPFLQKLLKKINKPLAQTSVNISGEKSLTKINDIVEKFSKRKSISLIVDGGDIKRGKSSKVIDLTKERLKRLR